VISAWSYSWELFEALGAENVKRKAAEGDRAAQYSVGIMLLSEFSEAAGTVGELGAGGRSPKANVGFELCAEAFPVAHKTEMR